MPTMNELKAAEELKNTLKQQKFKEDYDRALLEARRNDEAVRADPGQFTGVVDQHGKKETYWDRVARKAEDFIQSTGQQSYVEWHTGMMDIFGAAEDLAKALRFTPFAAALDDGTYEAGTRGKLIKLGLKYDDWRSKKQSHELTYSLEIDDKGVLTTKAFKNREPLVEKKEEHEQDNEKEMFDTLAVAWLKERGYNFDPANKKLTDSTGQPVTPAVLKDLQKDDEKGMKTYFADKFKLIIDAAPTPATSLSP
ncbi:Uncharacterised protein [Legionella beliardensis]|uniref:Uncharacterized protein n=1 Tax=Legionella beliardensis TaxID=91822 RepID=A0A378I352_9GAMM|nr:hypothetical protein [Legionella beliardensis]STX29135.1 Uncharacterised protein [Legionella beliardensis]